MSFLRGCAVFSLFAALMLSVVPVSGAQGPLAEAQREYNSGRYHRAVDILTDAVAKSPDDAPLHFLLGQCYYELREFTRAVASFERSVQLLPNQSEYHDWLGKAYGRRAEETIFLSAMGWARKTHKEFEVAVRLDPSNFQAQRDLIRFEMYAPGIVGGGDDRALKHIAELEKIDVLHGQLARGEFFATKKRFAEADAVFASVLESNTDRIGVYFEAADYYRDRQNPAKMSDAIAAAERIGGDDRRLKFYRGLLLVVKGKDPAEAESLLKSYIATVPDNSDLPSHSSALEWLGKLYEAQGRFSEAAQEYRDSLALDPHNKAVEEAWKRIQKK
jgi:tetratricopeptide (TPR) repeat protein